jgi:thymidylate kinase
MEDYLSLQRSRKNLINKLFNYINKKYTYVTLHHLETIFDKKTDIDLVIGCNKQEFIKVMKDISKELDLKIINFFTIDKNIYRLDFVFFDENNNLDTIELDCLLLGNEENLYKLNADYFLDNYQVKELEEYKFNTVEPLKEYEYYIKKKAYKNSDIKIHYKYLQELQSNKSIKDIDELYDFWRDYFSSNLYKTKYITNKISLTHKRLFEKPSLTISILGPDGSGKSTIIDKLFKQNIFRNKYYFHLKPLKQKRSENVVCEDPHKFPLYNSLKSYVKLLYFIFQYSFGWIKNITPLGFKSSLIVFDRYYDDILADHKRYRYGGRLSVVKFIRNFIPKPDIYFILTTDAHIIHNRKKEVTFEELERQIKEYDKLVDNKTYFHLDASKDPDQITNDMIQIISEKMYERY